MEKKASIALTFLILAMIISGLAGLYFFLDSKDARLGIMIAAVMVIVAGMVMLIFQLTHGASALRKKLDEVTPWLSEGPVESLKEKYMQIYGLYLKVSEGEKRNFYARVVDLREKIEEMLQAEKQVEERLAKSGEGSLAEKKKGYEVMHAFYQKLPKKAQEQFYPQVVNWKEELEKGV